MSRMLDALRKIETKLTPVDDLLNTDQPIGPYEVAGPVKDENENEDGNEDEDDGKDAKGQNVLFRPEGLIPPSETPAAENTVLVESIPEAISPQTGVPATPPSDIPRRAGDPQYSDLARRILSQLPKNRPASVLFTSPGDGQGKTTTLAPLCAAMADQMSEEILVVDANFRNPTLAELLGVEANGGLVDVLTGVAKWQDVVRKTSVDHLSVLPGGRFPSADGTPPDALDLAPLLTGFRRRFRLVAFDTASLSHPEVAPMSRFFDATYLVLELNETPQHTARQAVRILDECGGRLLGCVLRA